MEEYTINLSPSNNIICDGDFVKSIKKKHIEAYGESGSNNIFQNAIEMFEKSIMLVENQVKSNNILVIGKVQSGKTSNLEMFTAIAFDNGYNSVFIYGGYDNALLKQTVSRFKETFDIREDIDRDSAVLFATDDKIAINNLDESIMELIFERKKPTIFISMKQPSALNKINNMLQKINLSNIRGFIIDDEGDQASLNTQFKKDKTSATYDAICTMKSLLNDPLYLSVTATPQANIFQSELSKLKPSDTKLIEPGIGYVGAEVFHLSDKFIKTTESFPYASGSFHSIELAVYYFIIVSAIMLKRNINSSDMIIHTDKAVNQHSELYSALNFKIENMQDTIKYSPDDFDVYLREIKSIFNEEFFEIEILESYQFEMLLDEIKHVIKYTSIILQNGRGKNTMTNLQYKMHKIYIGAQLLQRGVTFKNLVSTYFTRWQKNGNMDTVLQRCRWFGYRMKFIDLVKIFTTETIRDELNALTVIDRDLWDQFIDIQNGDLLIDDIVVDASDSSLNPTRKNVGEYKKIKFRNKWNNQKTASSDIIEIRNNNILFESVLNDSGLCWIETDAGRTDSVKWTSYANVSSELIIDLITHSSTVFECSPFSKQKLINELLGQNIKIVKMHLDGIPRKRTFNNWNVSALQQGADSIDYLTRKYLGDSSVIIDKQSINIQIFKIQPKGMCEDFMQYMVSIYFPKDSEGFARK